MGSISGVSPTATDIANRKASAQSPLVMPSMSNTRGSIKAMKRIRIQATWFTPAWNGVGSGSLPVTRWARAPK